MLWSLSMLLLLLLPCSFLVVRMSHTSRDMTWPSYCVLVMWLFKSINWRTVRLQKEVEYEYQVHGWLAERKGGRGGLKRYPWWRIVTNPQQLTHAMEAISRIMILPSCYLLHGEDRTFRGREIDVRTRDNFSRSRKKGDFVCAKLKVRLYYLLYLSHLLPSFS